MYCRRWGRWTRGFIAAANRSPSSRLEHQEVRKALRATIARGNPVVPILRRSEIPPPVLLKYAGLSNTGPAFERGVLFWDIKENNGAFRIASQEKA